jgi:hypothetical protein
MMRRKGAYAELTVAENERVLGTLTTRSWGHMAVARTEALYFSVENVEDLVRLPHPLEYALKFGLQSSGSIDGAHRRDLVEAIKGSQMPSFGLAVNGKAGEQQPAEAQNGNGAAAKGRALL